MKKTLSMLLAGALALSLAACGQANTSDTQSTDDSASEGLQYVLGTPLAKEEEFKADDGTVLLTEKYELPQLELHDADGKAVELDTSDKAEICNNFNEEMKKIAEEFDASAQETLENARTSYAEREASSEIEWANYAEELTIGTTYQTHGLLSVLCNGYAYYGGTHPSSYSRAWNFDLSSGQFLTYDALIDESNPLGQTLKDALTNEILNQITDQGLAADYFDDYETYVNDLSANASICFNESGMAVMFDDQVLAPHAVGAQTFNIAYDKFYYALSEYVQSLFDLEQTDVVKADYRTTQEFWAWFNMSMPPLDSSAATATAEDGTTLTRVALGNIKTLDDLRELLTHHVSEELADEWIATGKFVEKDGALYVTPGERGSDIAISNIEYSVSLDGDSGELTQTVHYTEYNEDGTAKDAETTKDYSYPFTLLNGHAVFSAFPCPL